LLVKLLLNLSEPQLNNLIMKKMYILLLAALCTATTFLSCEKEAPAVSSTIHESSNATALADLTQNYVYTLAGNPDNLNQNNGIGDQAGFVGLGQMVADDGYLYALDQELIRKIRISDRTVTTLAGRRTFPANDGSGETAPLSFPSSIALGPDGNLYVAEFTKISKVTKEGVVTTVAGMNVPGHRDGPAGTALFRQPRSIAVCEDGAIYVLDDQSEWPDTDFQIRKISRAGVVSTLTRGPVGTPSSSWNINSLSVLNKTLYAAGTGIFKISSKGAVTTIKKDISVNSNSLLALPDGSFFIASNNQIKKVSANGAVSVFAGIPVTDVYGKPTEGPADSVDLHRPTGITLYNNILYIAVHPHIAPPETNEYQQGHVVQMIALSK
jgi:hypothetical protein